MNVPEKLFQSHTWLEINVYMFALRNTDKGQLRVSLQHIADEFNITKGKARYIMDALYNEKVLFRTTNARQTHGSNTENEQVTNNSCTTNARQAHKEKTIEERKHTFGEALIPYLDKGYSKEMIRAFFDYWTQVNDGGRKMHFEKQKTFQIANRLATWKRNNYGNGTSEQRMHTDGTVLHTKQMDYEKGTW